MTMFLAVSGNIEYLDSLVFNNIASAWSVNTIATRSSQWKRFLTFCIDHGLTPMPASPKTIARFLSDLGQSCKYTTVVNYLSSITTMHKFYGYQPEFRDSYYLMMAVKGIKVNIGSGVHQMVALSPKQLLQMYAHISVLDLFETSCWASIVFSFRTLLRKSNFLPDNLDYNPHLISRKDIEFIPEGLVVHVTTSKTDRSGGNPFKIVVYETTGQQPLCAVSWLKSHFKSTPELGLGMFVKQSSKGFVPLMYKDVLKFLKELVTYIGLDPQDAGLHSLRRSGASYLNAIGVSLPDIKLMGNWRSNSVFDYIKCSDERLASIQKTVADSLLHID